MHDESSNSAAVVFLDRGRVLKELLQAAAELKQRSPEVVGVYLFGSLVRGDWTAESDADLIVVADRGFPDWFERSRYQIYVDLIPTDTLVYTPGEFGRARAGWSRWSSCNRGLPGRRRPRACPTH